MAANVVPHFYMPIVENKDQLPQESNDCQQELETKFDDAKGNEMKKVPKSPDFTLER